MAQLLETKELAACFHLSLAAMHFCKPVQRPFMHCWPMPDGALDQDWAAVIPCGPSSILSEVPLGLLLLSFTVPREGFD